MKLPTIGAKAERPTKAKQHVVKAHAAVEADTLVRLNVEIPATLHRLVKVKAAQDGKSIKQVVLTLLASYSK